MSVNLVNQYVQEYSNTLALLLQINGGKLRECVMVGSHSGKAASPTDQVGKIEMRAVTERFGAIGRVDAATDRRWVTPSDFDLPQMVDSFDLLKMKLDPKGQFVQNAVKAAGRQFDRLIVAAFQAAALTGVEHGTSTSFTAGNEVDVAVGGANSKINLAKIRAVKVLMEAAFVDFEDEECYLGLTAVDHDALLGEIQMTSSDFNGGRPTLVKGRMTDFMGFQFKQTEIIEQVAAGTNEVTLPVWCKSGMHLGIWQDMKNHISERNDIVGIPWQVYTTMSAGATRLEESKVFAIESYRA